jgi:phage terminase large subunit GpA-like protein
VCYWFKPSGKRNEALDRRVYALAALHARPVPWEVLLRAAPTEPPPQQKEFWAIWISRDDSLDNLDPLTKLPTTVPAVSVLTFFLPF